MDNQFTVLLASENQGKQREFRQIFAGLPICLVLPNEIGLKLDVEENGTTFQDNAILKANAYAQASGLPVLADDSGLEVDALSGAPGVYSARYAGPGANSADRRRKLIRELAGIPAAQRTARFRCVLVLVWQGELHISEGVCEGQIAEVEQGEGGFGYDPLFFVPKYGRTMAQLSADEKNAISHRGQAARTMAAILQKLLLRSNGNVRITQS